MSLVDLFRETPSQVREKQVNQLISFAGEGILRDGNSTSDEFRSLLSVVSGADLKRLAEECLTLKFTDSGLALQDVVNQVGRRLGFETTPGRYRGTQGDIGFDGLWVSPEGQELVVEVKTTDAYRIDLNRIAGYRRGLIREERISEAASSILIVVGRQDTGDLEAQIRGSRQAWDVRLISVDYLMKLMELKEELEDPSTARRVRMILVPQEFTRVDGIVDVLFTTAEDMKQEEPSEDDGAEEQKKKRSFTPAAIRRECIERITDHLDVNLVKRSRAMFQSPDEGTAVLCAVSREYEKPTRLGYWYAFHPHQAEQLIAAGTGYVALGCGSPDKLLLIPYSEFKEWLPEMHQTTLDDGRSYWHVHVHDEGDRLYLNRKAGSTQPDLRSYLI